MTACSFLPAATQMIYDMGLQDLLSGVTFECPQVVADKAVIVRCVLEGKNWSSTEIDRIFSASKAQGKSLYYVEDEKLQAMAPDIIFTQDVCEVCQIDTACTTAAVAKLAKTPQLIALTPNTLEDTFQTAVTIATALGREEAAYSYLSGLQKRIDHILDKLRQPAPRTFNVEYAANQLDTLQQPVHRTFNAEYATNQTDGLQQPGHPASNVECGINQLGKLQQVVPVPPSVEHATNLSDHLQQPPIPRPSHAELAVSQSGSHLRSNQEPFRGFGAPLKRVMLMEWIEPIYNCGHWIPYQIACAGGIDMLSNPGGDSIVTSWEKIVRYDPEVLVIAPCGFTTQRAAEEMHLLQSKPGWSALKAVRNNAVFLADYDLFTQRALARLQTGSSCWLPCFTRLYFRFRIISPVNIAPSPKASIMSKHEEKQSPRCKGAFECKVGDVTQCQCFGLNFSPEEKAFIAGRFDDCLCRRCLLELKQPNILFSEKYFPNVER